ncbi:MAG: molybdopterin-dependent oxidoreductase [Candidatus Tectomicrobia bacterium]|nr:molybdopterin-dependent oxidoreductase [Candidatus Tectomicrobia bacterium]
MDMSQRRVIRTMCPMNCHPTFCGMLVEIEDGRLMKVSGDKENPDSRGFLCVRGQASREVIGNPARLLRPLVRTRRTEDAWREASWDEVLDLIAARMRAVGREAVGVWAGHGAFTTGIGGQFVRRFANLYGCQWWNPTIICWGLGAFGLGLTGVLETNTKEDMGEHADLILLWGANLASQPNTAPHLIAARRRGAYIITIDVRDTEAAAQSNEVLLIRPGTDAALALAMMHVIIADGLYDRDFVARHTIGFDALKAYVQNYSPEWASGITGISQEQIVVLARRYATTRPAMIVLGGSSMHKGSNGWQAGRAVACLPALTGNLGVPGSGLGPRHRGFSHGEALANITSLERRPSGDYIPNQMSRMTEALLDQRIRVLFLFGTNMLSSFADADRVAEGLSRTDFIVSHDLFMNDTARRFADVILPSTAWLEELGFKATNTHVYLMERALDQPGETRSLSWILHELAQRLGISGFYPWLTEEGVIDAILAHPSTGHATVASLREQGGIGALRVSHVAYPDYRFHTPSGKVEFYSERAIALGLSPLPVYEKLPKSFYPLAFRQGRTLTHFHAFYDHGQALPMLARLDPEPWLWISLIDAAARGIQKGAVIRIYNERGEFQARAQVTDRVPPGTVWMHDGWEGVNRLTSGGPCIPDEAVDAFAFSAGQAAFDAMVEVVPHYS